MNDFKFENNKIYSNTTGDLVAEIHGENLRMMPGKNAMTPRVKAFYEEVRGEVKTETETENPEDIRSVAESCQMEEEEEEVNTHLLDDELSRERIVFGDAPLKGGTSAPAAEKKPEEKKSARALSIWDIPGESLPAMDPALGVATPEFKNFVKKHKLDKEQTIELIKRLERRI